ncbi:MAG: alanine racemase [Erysipelotrichaceae bacterium]|nr:alanine racemase [Erysipelotrichaceae bacterium]
MLTKRARAWLEIDPQAIKHNVREVEKLVGQTKIMGIVKANAYGHGMELCAKALRDAGVDFFGVATVEEAVELRRAGITEEILVLGYTPMVQVPLLKEYDIIQTMVSAEYAEKVNAWAKQNGTRIRAHCKVDTGMNRIGIQYQDQTKCFDQIVSVYTQPNVNVEGIFSHFPVSDDLAQEPKQFTLHQIELFEEVLHRLKEQGIKPGITHIQNSYGILNYKDLGYDYCRPGLLYMGVTSDDSIPIDSQPDFIPALSLYANVSEVKWVQPGMSVSYGRHFRAQKPTKVASISVGYADGLPRLVSNQSLQILVKGIRCPLIGNICMDQCMVDVTEVEQIQEGDVVCVIGQENHQRVTVDEISRKAKTINNETLSALGARLPRIIKGEEE